MKTANRFLLQTIFRKCCWVGRDQAARRCRIRHLTNNEKGQDLDGGL